MDFEVRWIRVHGMSRDEMVIPPGFPTLSEQPTLRQQNDESWFPNLRIFCATLNIESVLGMQIICVFA